MAKSPLTTGQQNDLHTLCGFRQDLGHQVQPRVVGIYERIVEYEGDRTPFFPQQISDRKPCQNGELFLGA